MTKLIIDPEGLNYQVEISKRAVKEYYNRTEGQELEPKERVKILHEVIENIPSLVEAEKHDKEVEKNAKKYLKRRIKCHN